MKTKTAAHRKTPYSFPVPTGSKVFKFLKWFEKRRELIRKDTALYEAVEENFKDYMAEVTHKGGWTTKVMRCFRATEFIYRYKEWEIIVNASMNSKDDIAPENPLQHKSIDTTLNKYANQTSQAVLGANARVMKNEYKVSLDPTGLTAIVNELR